MPYCSHTYGTYSLPSSWTVELGVSIYVSGIIIFNRIGTCINTLHISLTVLDHKPRGVDYLSTVSQVCLLRVLVFKSRVPKDCEKSAFKQNLF